MKPLGFLATLFTAAVLAAGAGEARAQTGGSVVLKNKAYICNAKVTDFSVYVTIDDRNSTGTGNGIKFDPGCSGSTFNRIEVETVKADGVKVAATGVSNVLVRDGYILADASTGCEPGGTGVHQDGMQDMGGKSITWRNFHFLMTRCTGAGAAFVNGALGGNPTNVVIEDSVIARQNWKAAHINGSTNGVRNSTIYAEKSPAFDGSGFCSGCTIRVGPFDFNALLAEARAEEGSEDPPPPPPPPPDEDTEAPSAPPNLRVHSATDTELVIRWDPSSDNVGVVNYRIYKDGLFAGEGCGSTCGWLDQWTFGGLSPGTSYLLEVEALDEAGNVSPRSSLNASTTGGEEPPPPPPPPDEDPFLDEVQAVEQIAHSSSGFPKTRVADIDAIVHGLSGDTPCADKLERIDVVVHGSGWPQDKLAAIHSINHEAGDCQV